MVSVFFYCSSPYVGYTLKQADYVNREMKSASEKSMTAMGYKLFNSSGSLMVLGEFEGRKYFHTRQSQSENYDEQGRRIYTNVAFAAEDAKDEEIINKIALYVFFNEEEFYRQMADMILLLDDGFIVDFDKLSVFMTEKINNTDFSLKPGSGNAGRFYNDVMKCRNKKLSFVVTESTWSYFIKQAGCDFNNTVLYKFSSDEAQSLVSGSKFEPKVKENDNNTQHEEQTPVNSGIVDSKEKNNENESNNNQLNEVQIHVNSVNIESGKKEYNNNYNNNNKKFKDTSFLSSIFSVKGILACAAAGVIFIILVVCIFTHIFKLIF